MISINIILIILTCHWIFDFICQSDYMAMNKSKSHVALLLHTAVYSALWMIPMTYVFGIINALTFSVITFYAHTITDYFTSRITSTLYSNKQYRLFFNVIGWDQLLHYTQLFLTYLLLK